MYTFMKYEELESNNPSTPLGQCIKALKYSYNNNLFLILTSRKE